MAFIRMSGSVFSRLSWIFAFLLCVSPPTVKTEISGCSMVSLDLDHCLKPRNGFISIDDTCCTAVNQIVQAGYGCLCSLISASQTLPLLGTPLSLPLSNCLISAPPLTQCQAPTAVVLPSNGTHEEIAQPSSPIHDHKVAPMAPVEVPQAPLNSTGNIDNATIEVEQPQVTETDDPKSNMSNRVDEISNGEDNTKIHPLPLLLLILALQACKASY